MFQMCGFLCDVVKAIATHGVFFTASYDGEFFEAPFNSISFDNVSFDDAFSNLVEQLIARLTRTALE